VVGTVVAGYDGHRGWLYRVAVDPRVQRRGLGTALVQHAEAALAALGCPKINLQVRTSNVAVIAFYRKLGWEVEELVSLGKLVPIRERYLGSVARRALQETPAGEYVKGCTHPWGRVMHGDNQGIPLPEIARRGEEIYHRTIRPTLTEADRGKVVSIDISTGEYRIGKNTVETAPPLKVKNPLAPIWSRRVGFTAMTWHGNPPVEPI
jgi:hypothetical protein